MTRHGLREQKKAQTRADLADAAYQLVREHGLASLTADAVADRAGVSRRTFFNYFPSVESALTSTVTDFFDFFRERLAGRPADEPLMDSLERMAAGETEPALLERIAVMGAMADASPQARAMLQEFAHEWLGWFEGYIRERVGPEAEEYYVTALATSVFASTQAALRVWVRHTGGVITPETVQAFQNLLAHGLHLLRTGFDTETTRPTSSKDR